jgi:hypothetical protein
MRAPTTIDRGLTFYHHVVGSTSKIQLIPTGLSCVIYSNQPGDYEDGRCWQNMVAVQMLPVYSQA